jgi:effector-binding domain-containing protein
MKKVLYVIIGLLVLYLILCLVGPSKVDVSKSIAINAPADVVQKYVADFKNFAQWSPWQAKDPNMSVTYSGEAGQIGSKYEWEGNKEVGKGIMEITAINGDTVQQKLTFLKPWKGGGDVYLISTAEGSGTNFTWATTFPMAFFMRPMGLFMNMEKMVGKQYEEGLARLKTVIETQASAAPKSEYQITEMEWPEKTYFGSKKTMLEQPKIAGYLAENFPRIFSDFKKDNIVMESAPSLIIFSWNDATMSGEGAAALAASKEAPVKKWEKYTIPAGKVLQLQYFGNYGQPMMKAYDALKAYMKEKNLTPSWSIEEYVTDPMTEKDTAKWQTNIYCIVK